MQFSTADPRLHLRVYWVYLDIDHPFRLFDMQEEMAVAIFSGIVYDSCVSFHYKLFALPSPISPP